MTKKEWERQLLKHLKPLSKSEKERALEYYREMYDERSEAGLTEAEILREFGFPDDCAARILAENENSKATQKKPPKEEKPKKNYKKTWKAIGFSLLTIVLIGGAVTGVSALVGRRSVEQQTFTESAENPIERVNIDFGNAAIDVIVESATTLSVEYPQMQRLNGRNTTEITVTETDGCVSISEKQLWQYNIFAWNFKKPKVILHLPADRAYTLDLCTDNGDVRFNGDLTAQSVSVDTDNGDVYTTSANIVCAAKLYLETDNGDLELGNVTATNLEASTNNGDVTVRSGSIENVATLETDNGDIDIDGRFTAKEFYAETENGDIDGEDGYITASTIVLETNLGDVDANITGLKSDYTITVEQDLGDSNIHTTSGGEKRLSISTDVGDIEIYFVA